MNVGEGGGGGARKKGRLEREERKRGARSTRVYTAQCLKLLPTRVAVYSVCFDPSWHRDGARLPMSSAALTH